MSERRIAIKTNPNRFIRHYYVDAELSSVNIFPSSSGHFKKHGATNAYEVYAGDKVQKFIETVWAIEGVTSVGVDRHELSVTIGGTYSWKDIQPAVINALIAHVGYWVPEVSVISWAEFKEVIEVEDATTLPPFYVYPLSWVSLLRRTLRRAKANK